MTNYQYRITGIRTALSESWDVLPGKIEKACGLKPGSIKKNNFEIMKQSLDARDKTDLHYIYTIDFNCTGKMPPKGRKRITPAPDFTYHLPSPGEKALTHRPVVVGFGPCGIFAALALSRAGYHPLVIERGAAMNQRVRAVRSFWENGILDPESNVFFGEGGAGTFSDGKLTTGIKDPRIRHVLKTFVAAGAPEDILYQQKPHIGTDVLRNVVVNLRKQIENQGGEIRFDTCLENLIVNEEKQIEGIVIRRGDTTQHIPAEAVILAPGHSARDTFAMLKNRGAAMAQKPFSIGLRIEHPQAMIDRALIGDAKGLPSMSYKLNHHASNGRGVYTFCMCPGGEVIPAANEPGLLCVNGMSNRDRDSGIANAAVLADVRPSDFDSDDVLAGVAFQRKWERLAFQLGGEKYRPPKCTWQDFQTETEAGRRVAGCLPDFAAEAIRESIPVFGKKIAGFDRADAVLTAAETRSSSPVRILRDEQFNSNIAGLYPAGEGAGYAGGITSAACDGLRAAEQLIMQWYDQD